MILVIPVACHPSLFEPPSYHRLAGRGRKIQGVFVILFRILEMDLNLTIQEDVMKMSSKCCFSSALLLYKGGTVKQFKLILILSSMFMLLVNLPATADKAPHPSKQPTKKVPWDNNTNLKNLDDSTKMRCPNPSDPSKCPDPATETQHPNSPPPNTHQDNH